MISTYTLHGDFDGAAPFVLDCLDFEPTNPHCLSAWTSISLHDGDLDEAARAAELLQKVEPDGLWTNLSTAEVLNARGDPAGGPLYARACEQGNPYACSMAPTP
ncbi:MAG: hypothetical protein H6736_21530 [Alphaproteobacteria bacterium]|nr:hypothetical protein [Alphaproteobacteria bacterium]